MKGTASRSAWSSVRGRRSSNQDAVVDVRLPGGRHLVAVADGMGGHRGGEVASATALEALTAALRAEQGLREAVLLANAAVYERAGCDPGCRGMGTTLVALLITGTVYQIANVGDSRAYRVDRTGIHQVSRDHSVLAEAHLAGGSGLLELARSPWRNALTRSLGTEPRVAVDLFGPFEVLDSHAVVLCTDGLYKSVPDAAIREQLLGSGELAAAVNGLAELALSRGSDDNVSVAIVAMGEVLRTGIASQRPTRRDSGAAAPARHAARPPAPESGPPGRRRSPRRGPRTRAILTALTNDNLWFGLCASSLVAWLLLTLAHG